MHFEALGTLVVVLDAGFSSDAGFAALMRPVLFVFAAAAFSTLLLLQFLLVQLPLIFTDPHTQNSAIKFIPSVVLKY